MTRPLKLDLPSLRFAGHAPARPRGGYNPWADEMNGGILPVGFKPLPDGFVIERVQRSIQHPWQVPQGYHGRAALIANLGGYYGREAGNIAGGVEDCHPRVGTIGLATITLQPNMLGTFIDVVEPIHGPITLSREAGDRLFLVSEDNGVAVPGGVELFFSLLIRPQPGLDRLDALEPGIIHTIPLSGTAPGGAMACYRSLIPVPADARPGSHLSVYVASGADGLVLSSLGVGVQSGSGPDMLAAPTAVSGALTLGASKGVWLTAAAPAGMTPGCNLLFDIAIGGPWAFKTVAQPGFDSWHSGVVSATTAVMQGTPVRQPQRTHVVYAVKWWTP